MTIPIINRTNMREVYTVSIEDPDIQCFVDPEVKMVVAAHEIKYWIDEGKLKPQDVSYEAFTSTDTVTLEPGQKIDLLFKFLTLRDVTSKANGISSPDTACLRKVKIIFKRNMDLFKTVEA